ncbi:MAG: cupin domain-containing protein [Candidatus Bathyarchaeia archaeon]
MHDLAKFGVESLMVLNYSDVEAKEAGEGAANVRMRWLISKEVGAENFAMRHIEIGPQGHSPLHSHPWEHEIFVLEGEGVVTGGADERTVREGDFIFIPPNEMHQTRNTSQKTMKLLCMIPYKEKS